VRVIEQPFSLFAPFRDQLSVQLWVKEDQLNSDGALRKAMGSTSTASVKQVHGGRCVVVRSAQERNEEADGLLTDTSGLTLLIRAADCQMFVVYAPTHHVVGLMHAGWRGLLAGMIPSFFAKLERAWGIAAHDTYVGVGPSLCTACAGFTSPAAELPGIDAQFFSGRQVNLRGIADDQLLRVGVSENRIERMNDCTRCLPEVYWSYRADREAIKNGWGNMFSATLL
jgi:YfiH family protein